MLTVKLVYGKPNEPTKSAIIREAESVQYARGDNYHLVTMLKDGEVCGEFQVFDNSNGIVYIENEKGKTIQTYEAFDTI